MLIKDGNIFLSFANNSENIYFAIVGKLQVLRKYWLVLATFVSDSKAWYNFLRVFSIIS